MANNIFSLVIENTNNVFVFRESTSKNDGQYVYYYATEDSAEFDCIDYQLWSGGELICENYNIDKTISVASADQILNAAHKNHTFYSFVILQEDINSKLTINTLYTLRIRAKTADGTVTAWSNGAIRYAIWEPVFKLYGGLSYEQSLALTLTDNEYKELSLTKNDNILYIDQSYRLRGELSFIPLENANTNINIIEDDTLAWWQVSFYKKDVRIGGTNGYQYPDRFWDSSSKKVNAVFDLTSITEDDKIELVVLYCTTKGYKGWQSYSLTATAFELVESVSNSVTIDLKFTTPNINHDLGFINLETVLSNPTSTSAIGTFEIERSVAYKHKLDFATIYQETLVINAGTTLSQIYYDQSAEGNIPYLYRVRFFIDVDGARTYAKGATDNNGNYKPYAETLTPVSLNIEDSFLITKDLSLRIKYNPTLTNYKRNYIDTITPTLGGEYPFIRRNGHQKYRTFTFGGLISYHENDADMFYSDINNIDSILNNSRQALNQINTLPSFIRLEDEFQSGAYLTEYAKEKLYRDKVLEFLYSDQVFLFKAPAEGNIFVKLSNISLTADQKLGRMIYSFSATATETMAPTAENYTNFFSHLYTDSDFIIRIISASGSVNDGRLTAPAGALTLKSSYNLKIANAKLQYRTEEGYVDNIELGPNGKTYLDFLGHIVPTIEQNGQVIFKPGYFPATQIINIDETNVEATDILQLQTIAKEYNFQNRG